MMACRRQFLKDATLSLAGLGVISRSSPAIPAELPDSTISGVQIGTITYSYRSMPDQSAEGLLAYVVESGISAVELMGDSAEAFAGAPADPNPEYPGLVRRQALGQLTADDAVRLRAMQPARENYLRELAEWRATASMDRFEELRRLYENAGVSIYAWKPSVFSTENSDTEIEYGFRAARALGATHCTTELPADPAQSLRLGRIAESMDVFIAYHTHEQGSMTAFDAAFRQSDYNRSNVDLGHFVAAPNGGDPLPFLRAFHDRIASVHLKDRRTHANGGANLPWGEGDTPLTEILTLMRDEQYDFPATVEVEYRIPDGSDAVEEVRRCVDYCRAALEGAAA